MQGLNRIRVRVFRAWSRSWRPHLGVTTLPSRAARQRVASSSRSEFAGPDVRKPSLGTRSARLKPPRFMANAQVGGANLEGPSHAATMAFRSLRQLAEALASRLNQRPCRRSTKIGDDQATSPSLSISSALKLWITRR